MKNLVFFTFFLILITFSVHQNAIAETEEEQERKKAIEEAADSLKRKIVNEKPIEETIEDEKPIDYDDEEAIEKATIDFEKKFKKASES